MARRHTDTPQRERGDYATPDPTVRYMVQQLVAQLHRKPGIVIDPAAGDGVFLRALKRVRPKRRSIGFDLHAAPDASNVRSQDFFEYFAEARGRERVVGVIGNPPYNCHESAYIRSHKRALKGMFREIGVLNTYAMFLYAGLDLLADGGVLCMITMDSFLTARFHRPLREFILRHAEIVEILLAPRRLFHTQRADVRTAIITLRKTASPRPEHTMRLVDRVRDETEYASPRRVQELPQAAFAALPASRFIIGVPASVRRLFTRAERTVGDAMPGGAGISTGADAEFLRTGQQPAGWVPFFKNPGRERFFREPDTFITPEWETLSQQRKTFMVRNRALLLREGVCCSSMGIAFSAVLLPKGSLFGVNACLFPTTAGERFFLLGLLNSALATYLVRAVLIRTNMVTPGYVKQIPYRYDAADACCREVASLARQAYRAARRGDANAVAEIVRAIDSLVLGLYDIPEPDRAVVSRFAAELFEAL